MQSRLAFCTRCGGMRLGWNKRFMTHWLFCRRGLTRYSPAGAVILVAVLTLGFPEPSASTASVPTAQRPAPAPVIPVVDTFPQEVQAIEAFLKFHKVSESKRTRLAESIVRSARKHKLNARLLASIMIVESRGNQFAISGQDAVGIMQIHLPTWGTTADRENINLLKVEDNIDFGARILKDYVRRFGVSGGVRRYNGFIPGEPEWERSSQVYLDKVQQVYESRDAAPLMAALMK